MSANWSLRNRLSVTLALFSGLVSVIIATMIYIASHDLEARIIDDTLTAELDDYVERRQRNPHSLPEKTATIRAYVIAEQGGSEPVPEEIRHLQPGKHDVELEGVVYRAGVRLVGDQHFVVLYDTSSVQRRERSFLGLLTLIVVVVSLLSALAGRWLARVLIAPVNELGRRVSELDPEQDSLPLAEEFPWVEVRSLAEDFDRYLKRLHDFIQRERLFTGDISHELRTPLAVISGATELMLNDDQLDERNHKRVLRIVRAANGMKEMSAALLALAREKSEAEGSTPACDVPAVAGEVVERYRELFKHKPVEILLETLQLPKVHANAAILAMILGNLVHNALNFTDQGRVVVCIDQDGITVTDDGPGLGMEDPMQLYQPYKRGGHEKSGTGLGLSLVWRLCELTGWHIELKNRPEGGTQAQLRF